MNLTLNETLNETLNYTAMYAVEVAKNSTKTQIIVGLSLATLGLGFYAYKKFKERKQLKEWKEEIQNVKNQVIQAIKDAKEGKEIKEININNLPEEVQESIINTDPFFKALFGKETKTKEPYLFLMQRNQTIKVLKNAKEGVMDIKQTDKEKTEGTIHLTNAKLHVLKIGSKKRKVWIHHESEAESYPIREGWLAKQFRQLVMAIKLSGMGALKPKKKFPKILIILILLGVLAAILYFSGAFDKLFGKEIVEGTANIIQNASNATGNIDITPVQG